MVTTDLFKVGVLSTERLRKYPQYLIRVMPAQGNLKRFTESFF
jgi:hypothetical protein